MEKQTIKDIMYGGINELMNNRDYYFRSEVGAQYSSWTEKGQVALMTYTVQMSRYIQTAEDKVLDKRSKELVIKGLKGETI
jgi:hypothetical protein